MELGLTLGDLVSSTPSSNHSPSNHLGLGFNTTLSIGPIHTNTSNQQEDEQLEEEEEDNKEKEAKNRNEKQSISSGHEFVQLDLLPHTPVVVSRTNPSSQIPFPWLPSQNGSTSRGLDVNRLPAPPHAAEPAEEDEAALSSSPPNSAASSFQMDLCIYNRGCKRDNNNSDGDAYYNDQRGGSSRASDEDDNVGSTRKKLRLSKEQSAFLEESFKEHSTLNPKQKLALAKQLNLRPRQVEVWFQNRRARTKLKQTEVDCEYLKRCCETLSEENRRLQKELQELRALKSSNSSPFFMQLPATTLTMCPSCEKVATNNNNSTSTITTNTTTTNNGSSPIIASPSSTSNSNSNTKPINGFVPLNKPKFYPFSHTTQS